MNYKFDGSKVFFTSDTHFYHGNIIRFCNRPFKSVEMMNETIISNWNNTVGQDDIVFHLGDFCLGGSAEWSKILDRLNGKIYLIMGNHDLKNIRQGYISRFGHVAMQMHIEVGKQKIYLNHYPFLCFDGGYKDVWQLFGHVHTRQNNTGIDVARLQYLYPTQYDVGVDNNNFTPVSFDQVKRIINNQIEKGDSSMKIQYMSDLHLEFCDNSRWLKHNELPVTGDILVLAGDIFYLKNRIAPLSNFWKWASANYRQVLIVPGNHEYYNFCDVMDYGLQWNWMFKNNVGYHQNQVVRIDDTDFIMSTLWSQISPSDEYFVWKGMNDFRQIMYNGKLLQIEEFNLMHNCCLNFIKRSLAESTAEHIVVVTHHLPPLEVVAPHHKGSVLNSAFATDLSKLIADNHIDAWIYGHSHTNIDAEINGTKVVCNQMGYVFDNEHISNGFDPGKCLIL